MSTELKDQVKDNVEQGTEPKKQVDVQRATLLEALKQSEIHEDDYAFDGSNSYRKRMAIAKLLGESSQDVYQFTRTIGYRNFNDLTDMNEVRELYQLWKEASKRQRKMDVLRRIF